MDTPNLPDTTPKRKIPSGWGKFWAAMGLGAVAYIGMALASVFGLLAQRMYSLDDNATFAICEGCAALVTLLFLIALGGRALARPSLKGMGEAWKAAIWLFVVDGTLVVVGIVEMAIGVEPFELATDWPVRVAVVAALCLGVGVFEESLTRGILLNGFLARMGRTRAGVYGAVILSSLAFGMMHFDFFIDFSDGLQVAQNVMKVVQTGMCGFFFAGILIKTRNIWTVISIHAVNDFMLMFISNGLTPEVVSTEYVAIGDEGISILIVYCIICALYIPLVVISKRLIDQASPWRGAFYRYGQPSAGMPGTGMPGVVSAPMANIPAATPVAPQPAGIPRAISAMPAAGSAGTQAYAGDQPALEVIDEATAKAMRGKHAAPLKTNPAKGTPDDQGL